MDILSSIYSLVKHCYGPTTSSRLLLVVHPFDEREKTSQNEPDFASPLSPRFSLIDTALALFAVHHFILIEWIHIMNLFDMTCDLCHVGV
jgi:hypothetical protein